MSKFIFFNTAFGFNRLLSVFGIVNKQYLRSLALLFGVITSLTVFCEQTVIAETFSELTTTSTTGGTGMPTNYGIGDYVLASGTWTFTNAQAGTVNVNSSPGCQIQGATNNNIISPNVSGGVGVISFYAAGTSAGAAVNVSISVNGGEFSNGTSFTGLSTTSMPYSLTINDASSNIRVRFKRTAGTLTLDDILITSYTMPPILALPVPNSLINFSATKGSTSASQTFSISGFHLTDNLIITAPSSFEIRENGTGSFGSSVSFEPVSGTVPTKTIEVRIASVASAGSLSANIVCSSANAGLQSVALSGFVTLSWPIANAATNPIATGFTANWQAVSGAYEYKLDVSSVSTFMSSSTSSLVSWNFTNNLTATTGIFENSTKTISTIGAGTAMISSNTARSDNWNEGNASKFWEVEFVTTGFSNCKLSSKQRSTSTGPKDFKLEYKIGVSGVYKEVNEGSITVADNYTTGVLSNVLLPKDCDNKPSVFIRWIMTSNTAVNGSLVGAGGANNIDDIAIVANAQSMIPGYNDLTVSGTSENVIGLLANSSYFYRVRAIGSNIISDNSTTITALTAINSLVNASILMDCPSCNLLISNGGELNVNVLKTFNSVTVAAGAKLTISNGVSFTPGNFQLESNASGTATFVDENSGSSLVSISASVQQYLSLGRNWYVSIPVSSANVSALSSASSVVCWNEPLGNWAAPEATILQPLKGYISVNTTSAGPITFSGVLNNGEKSIPLTRTTGVTKEGFNLVGNPYPSYLNWTSNTATAANVLPTIWYRTKPEGSSYVFYTYNAQGNVGVPTNLLGAIPPLQAFWVRVNAGGGTLTFNNSMRSHSSSSNLLKAPVVRQPLLRLQLIGSLNTDETVVYFNSNALNEYDLYDSPKMAGSVATTEIYTLGGSDELVINALKNFKLDNEIPLGFRPGAGTEFSIKVTELSNFDSNIRVFLKDATTNKVVDITDAEYNFGDVKASNSRFSIFFKNTAIPTDNDMHKDQQILISKNTNHQIFVNCNGDWGTDNSVTVHNAFGQSLIMQKMEGSSSFFYTPKCSGVYFVTVINAGNKICRKVIVN